jgi:hypothetical protein
MTPNVVVKEATVMAPTACLTGTTYQSGVSGTTKIISMGGLRGVMRVATSTTNQQITLPVVSIPGNSSADANKVMLQGKFLRIMNESTLYRLEFAFGVGAAVTLVYGQTATMAAGHASAGWRLPPESWVDVIVPPDATHFAHIQETGAVASTLAMYCSEGDTGGK